MTTTGNKDKLEMFASEKIEFNNCRLCHENKGDADILTNEALIDQIYECTNIIIKDESSKYLPTKICTSCKTTIDNFHNYRQHIQEIDRNLRRLLRQTNRNFCCKTCKKYFEHEPDYNNHLLEHNSDSSSVAFSTICNVCNEKFLDKDDYAIHQRSHKTQLICGRKNCGKVCTTAYSLKIHEMKHDGKQSFLCVTCGKGFVTKNSLTCHEKIHSAIKNYICKLCNIGFSVRSNLRAHEKKYHEGVRFYCSKCTKEFVTKCSLERHERLHTGIKDFQCESCPAAFYTNKELLKHQRYHQGLKLHKCDECFKTFFERHHLIIHLRSHTGERPYVCKIPNCGKSFADSQKLKRHRNAKHLQNQ